MANVVWFRLAGRDLTRYLLYEKGRVRIWIPINGNTLSLEVFEEGVGFISIAEKKVTEYEIIGEKMKVVL